MDRELLELLKTSFGVSSDRDLARRLGIPASTIFRVLNSEGELGWQHRFTVLDKLGFIAARAGVSTLLPASLANKLSEVSNGAFQGIIERAERLEQESADANLVRFLETYSELRDNAVFNSSLGLERCDRDLILDGDGTLTDRQRVRIVESLHRVNSAKWNFNFSKLSDYIFSTENLLDAIEEFAYPLNESSELNIVLLDGLIDFLRLKSDKELGKRIFLSSSQISKIRNGEANISMRTRLKILYEIERESISGEILDFDAIDELAKNPELILQRIL